MVREAYLKPEVAIPDFLAALKEANPDDGEYIDTKLKEYNNGELRAPAVSAAPLAPGLLGAPARRHRQTDPRFFFYAALALQIYAILRTKFMHDNLMAAFEKNVPGFSRQDMIVQDQHPILV